MSELSQMLEELPEEQGSHCFKLPAPNAFVCRDKSGRVGIFPVGGGWLGAPMDVFEADIAPFCD